MITKLTPSNNELYQARFASMNEAFAKKGLSLEIKSLEEYFANIKTIFDFTTSYPEYTGRCLMMAVDEPLFEIDANSRIINVPAEFKKNGVAVIGDHQAETVYFKIDKYFDYQSFYDLLQGDDKGEVVINWSFTPAGSKVATEVKSVKAFGPSDDLQPGYLIFGWIIDKDMTTAAGTLTFSVQFYHTINGEIDYSFNTLTASVPVGSTLKMKSPAEVTDNSATLGLRLKNSPYRVDAIEGPSEPIWINDLEPEVEVPENAEAARLAVQAGIEKGLTINYRWFATYADEGTPVELTGEDEYRLTDDAAPVDNALYYVAIQNENTTDAGYKLLVGDEKTAAFEAIGTPDEVEIWERYNYIDVDRAGRYSAEANAKVDISEQTEESLSPEDQDKIEALTKSITSTVCTIPAASDPVVALEATPNAELSYEVIDPANVEFVYVADEKAPSIDAYLRQEETDKLGSVAAVVLDAEGKILGTDTVFADLDAAAVEELGLTFTKYNEKIEVTNSLTEQGTYKVGIINRLNKTYGFGESGDIKTSFVAPEVTSITVSAASSVEGAEPIIVLNNGEQAGEEGRPVAININEINTLLYVDNMDYSDYPECEVEYWLQEVSSETNMEPPAEADPAEVQLMSQTFMPHDSGYYRIKVITKYNNTQRIGYTGVFSLFAI